jgi:hypothetical protein
MRKVADSTPDSEADDEAHGRNVLESESDAPLAVAEAVTRAL